ncbi:MAG TPA: helicase [Flavobacteriia bacterium]|nr:helicase [Flavobacteriia bacterium]
MKNPELDLAWDFVEKTDKSIFLTGKAGTGKTTFLHKIKTESKKRLVVVAPTGVAAINAKGVTIHSFFQMPFGPIIPGERQRNSGFKHKFSKNKINIIRSLDLLIIDEISMVRVDLLDGIDQLLRRYRDRNKVFGGVQVLMIGDLQQLAPIIKPYEWQLLKNHYENAYFFSSNSFKKSNAVKIELKKIYRQEDESFITILNEIRSNRLSEKSIKVLNKHYQPNFSPKKEAGYITLTTHNNRANAINQSEMDKLTVKPFHFNAKVTGKFNEYAYPTDKKLVLKKGAQVMFIKNDSSFEKQYYNGKIGTITHITKESVFVHCKEDDFPIEVKPETWENVSYTLDEETKKISEKIEGSFTQIPLRLAWAITIHKSQGLTFEKAIIDAEASFAHGQTYVALSRCKTLEGIVLKTPISAKSIISDTKVTHFTDTIEIEKPNQQDLNQAQKQYQLNCIANLFEYYSFLYPINRIIDIYYKNSSVITGNIIQPIQKTKDAVSNLLKVSNTFKKQLTKLTENKGAVFSDSQIKERLHKGIAYFLSETEQKIKKNLDLISFTTDNKQINKDLTKQIDTLEGLITIKQTLLEGLKEGFSLAKYLNIRAEAVIDIEKKTVKKRKEIVATEHPILYEELREIRKVLADAEAVPAFTIFKQSSLFELCKYLPSNEKELQQINGFGKIRIAKYSEEILDIINAYRIENKLDKKFEIDFEVSQAPLKTKKKKINTKDITLQLFKEGKSIAEIAKERNLTINTIQNHLLHFLASEQVKVTDFMTKNKFEELSKIINKTEFDGLSDLKSKINSAYTYFELKLVLESID